MSRSTVRCLVSVLGAVLLLGGVAAAHITPPVVLASDREAIVGLLAGARRFFVREVRLSAAEQQTVKTRTGWNPEDDFYRFYIGRDDQGRVVAAAIFLTDFTIHGPVRVAVALGPDGKVKGATVVELTEETYAWIKPLLDENVMRAYVGRDGQGSFTAPARGDSMGQFYGQVIASLIHRAAVLFEVVVVKRGGAG